MSASAPFTLGVNYWPGPVSGNRESKTEDPRWARYALNEDYHDTIRPGLIAAGRLLEQECNLAGTDYRYYVEELQALPDKIRKVLDDKERIQWFAAKYSTCTSITDSYHNSFSIINFS